MEYVLKVYYAKNGKCPLKQWLDNLPDLRARVAIELRFDRLKFGNLGQSRSLGSGLYELKINLGPGYRVYFGIVGQQVLLMLCAGNKQSQQRDIIKAREYFEDYTANKKNCD